MYDYIRQAYGINPIVGQRVLHTETKRVGVVMPEGPSNNHYVQVKFDGDHFSLPCHPKALADEMPAPEPTLE